MRGRRTHPRIPWLLASAMILGLPGAAVAAPETLERGSQGAKAVAQIASSEGASVRAAGDTHQSRGANFRGETAAADVKSVADWAVTSRDNIGLPFVIVDKVNARVFVFGADGLLTGAAAVLIGVGQGDDSVPGIGKRRLATITPKERTTPSGRFVASLGHDFVQDILWIDYASSLSLHRVVTSNAKERRAERLASASVEDNRISYGCINVPARFYDEVVARAFVGTVGIVYILPETRSIESVFAMQAAKSLPPQGPDLPQHSR